MKKISSVLFILLIYSALAADCKKGGGGSGAGNHSPSVELVVSLIKVNPFTYEFVANATDQEFDPLTYTWDFGEGTSKQGANKETFTYQPDKTYTVKVKVTDGKSTPVEKTALIDTKLTVLTADNTKKFQIMDGFGGFGAQMEYWGNGPFTSAGFVNTLINDLGLTILRDNIPSNFEIDNDNNDPFNTDLTKYNINNSTAGHDGKLADHLQFLKDMKAAGLQKLIVSIWTPAPWMKHNNKVGNGTANQNSAPAYATTPDITSNQLRTDMYNEFAEYCVAYIKTIKQETGIDVYALSMQNEPRFSQFYASCVYNGDAMRDVIKVLGKRLEDEGLTTKLFLPEDVGWYDGIKGLVDPVLADADARKYVDIIAVHGYANDGVNPGSTDAQTWQNMYNWGAPYNIPLWMTETSGYPNTQDGAMALSKAMYIALKYGNASAWVFWSISTTTLDAYSLMSSAGAKSKRYFVSKNYYKYVRPGAQRFEITSADAHVLPLAFVNTAEASTTIVITNDENTGKAVKLTGTGIPAQFSVFVTSENKDCEDMGVLNASDVVLVPAKSVVTIYKK